VSVCLDGNRERLEEEVRRQVRELRAHLAVAVGDCRGWRLEVAAGRRKHLASVVKLIMVVVALRQAEQGRFDLSREVVLGTGPGQIDLRPSYLSRLHQGLRLTHRDLLYLMITLSDSVIYDYFFGLLGAAAVADHLADLGLEDTRLDLSILELNRRSYGLSGEQFAHLDSWIALQGFLTRCGEVLRQPEVVAEADAFRFQDHNFSTARDVCLLLESLLGGRALGGEHADLAVEILCRQTSRNRLPSMLPPAMDGYVGHQVGLIAVEGDNYLVINDCGFLDLADDNRVVVVCLADEIEDPAWAVDRAMGNIALSAYHCFRADPSPTGE